MIEGRRIIRCACYTRKSSEEGLDQDFNSLDAQFEACSAYIASQRHEGWRPISTRYDDGGYSGGTLERPALQRLLAAIDAGQVDMVVVYKIDRLTRSLLDFGKLVERLDKAQCSFVSVTQSFNTSTSMGRLTLNMLLSFAQFEREVTGERIRDKIAASKKKGLWMGGIPPFGYLPDNRQLKIDAQEAAIVLNIFALYETHLCVVRTKIEADKLGLRSRRSVERPKSNLFTRSGIYWLLTNPIYAGRIRHKDQTYPGQHAPIIDPARWDALQQALVAQAGGRRRGRRNAAHPSPMAGKIVDEFGERLTPSHAATGAGRRRYYVSRRLIEGARGSDGWRLPASHIEETLAAIVRSHVGAADAATKICVDVSHASAVSNVERKLGAILNAAGLDDVLRLIRLVELLEGRILIHLDKAALAAAVEIPSNSIADGFLRCSDVFQLRRRGVEARLVLGDDPVMLDAALVRFVARARAWWRVIINGVTIADLAEREHVSKRLISLHLPAALLAPDIILSILEGRQPPSLNAKALREKIVPWEWSEQRALFGIPESPLRFAAR